MTFFFEFVDPDPLEDAPTGDSECSCPDPDDQYLMEIDCGSISLTHKACGKPMAGDLMDSFFVDRIPVTVTAQPNGNCDGSAWHGEYRCDCGISLVATINGHTVTKEN
ncbi:hypothetical protein [Streptomyces sp. NPDC055036]